MNSQTFKTIALRIIGEAKAKGSMSELTFVNPFKPSPNAKYGWEEKDEETGWKFNIQIHWLDEDFHDIHNTARKRGERRVFDGWFEFKDGKYVKV